ncbi:MAG: hypothetical protein AB1473_04800 [Thermodesulfobacteriota bacterium]
MSEAVRAYIRSQGIGAAVGNIVLNPAFAWLSNREMAFTPLSGGGSIIVDTAITSVVMSLVVALFVASGTRREIAAGRIGSFDGFSQRFRLLSWLPRQGWALGLIMGVAVALVVTPLIFILFSLLGIAGLPFAGFALFKAVWTPLVAFVVARWVVLRQLLPVPTA